MEKPRACDGSPSRTSSSSSPVLNRFLKNLRCTHESPPWAGRLSEKYRVFRRDKNLQNGLALVATRKSKSSEDAVKRLAIRTVFGVALFAAAVVLSGCASARYRPRYYDGYYDSGSGQQARTYGFQNGYRDGYRKGQHEGRENDPGDINVRALEKATHGYQSWMGPIDYFQDGYRDGYRRGFRRGYQATNRGWRDRDYDDEYR